MIDIEDEVFGRIAEKLREQFPGITVYGEEMGVPSSFPCVTIVEADNSTDTNTLDSSMSENHANLMYETNAYSNLSEGKKAQCKAIMTVINEEYRRMGFVRLTLLPTPMQDATISRMTARHAAKADKNKTIYRR